MQLSQPLGIPMGMYGSMYCCCHCYFTDVVTDAAGTRLVLTTLTLTDIIPIPSRHNITT